MKVRSIIKEEDKLVIEFSDDSRGITWFRYLSEKPETWELHDWLNSLIEDVKVRS